MATQSLSQILQEHGRSMRAEEPPPPVDPGGEAPPGSLESVAQHVEPAPVAGLAPPAVVDRFVDGPPPPPVASTQAPVPSGQVPQVAPPAPIVVPLTRPVALHELPPPVVAESVAIAVPAASAPPPPPPVVAESVAIALPPPAPVAAIPLPPPAPPAASPHVVAVAPQPPAPALPVAANTVVARSEPGLLAPDPRQTPMPDDMKLLPAPVLQDVPEGQLGAYLEEIRRLRSRVAELEAKLDSDGLIGAASGTVDVQRSTAVEPERSEFEVAAAPAVVSADAECETGTVDPSSVASDPASAFAEAWTEDEATFEERYAARAFFELGEHDQASRRWLLESS